MAISAAEPPRHGNGNGDGGGATPGNDDVMGGPAVCDYIKDMRLDLQRLAERTGCPELATLLARAAAEAHHQAEQRKP